MASSLVDEWRSWIRMRRGAANVATKQAGVIGALLADVFCGYNHVIESEVSITSAFTHPV